MNSTIINLTQHYATEEQKKEGVIDLPEALHNRVKELLNFVELPSASDMKFRAIELQDIVVEFIMSKEKLSNFDETLDFLDSHTGKYKVMLGGAPFFMSILENSFGYVLNMPVVYAFSVRESVESVDENGNVKKVSVFKHKGFVEVS